MKSALITLGTIQELLARYEASLCNVVIRDPRGYRVRFGADDFVHFIKLTTRYGQEHRNRRHAVEAIKRGEIHFEPGRFDEQRATELTWAKTVAAHPDIICRNWQPLGIGHEAYVKDFGRGDSHIYRVLICTVIGQLRQAVTQFPCDQITEGRLRGQIWAKKRGATFVTPSRGGGPLYPISSSLGRSMLALFGASARSPSAGTPPFGVVYLRFY